MSPQKPYPIAKCHHILRQVNRLYQKRHSRLSLEARNEIEQTLEGLSQALDAGNAEKIQEHARKAESLGQTHLSKNLLDHIRELTGAILFALIVATLIRQLWFEPYEIPTGSMRPTLKEEDRLLVTKTQFGLNNLLTTGHVWFNEEAVERNGIFVFTAEGMEIANPDTTYFWFFPGKKLLIKRCLGKPGDTLYFYGGQIYGIDREGRPLKELLSAPGLERIDHVPFMSFEGKVTSKRQANSYEITLNQMNIPVGRVHGSPYKLTGEVFNGSEWVKDQPSSQYPSATRGIQSYSDLWGFGNFAMARLVTREELAANAPALASQLPATDLYLELRHHADLTYPLPSLGTFSNGELAIELTPHLSAIPLNAEHIKALQETLYTARFGVQNGYMFRHNSDGTRSSPTSFSPRVSGVSEGVYEFYYGRAYEIRWGGIAELLPQDHPLYLFTPYRLQLFFNLGLDFNTHFLPSSKGRSFFPQRFAYFRDGDLYVMGGLVFKKGDPLLSAFIENENALAASALPSRPYQPFIDRGAPIHPDGSWDTDFIRAFGVRIPEKHYLALGDNYAMSGDSREFGFVPEENIKGAPTFIIWPPGSRWGPPVQAAYSVVTSARVTVWIIAFIAIGGSVAFKRYRRSKRVVLYKSSHEAKGRGAA